MIAKMIYIGKEREKENDTPGEIKQNRCIVGKTHNHDKIAGEEKCVSETEGVKERQTTGEGRSDRKCKEKT